MKTDTAVMENNTEFFLKKLKSELQYSWVGIWEQKH